LIRKVEFENGLEKNVTNSYDSEITSTEKSFYKKSLLVKWIRKYAGEKAAEIYYYKYDSLTHELLSAKGYQKGKLIFSEVRMHIKDTLLIKTASDWNFMLTNDKELIYYSSDSLTQINISFVNNQKDGSCTIKKFSPSHLLIGEIDSSKSELNFKTFIYDSLSRLCKIIESDSVQKGLTEYKFNGKEKQIFSYWVSKKNTTKWLYKQELTRFDDKGLLLYGEIVDYEKSEVDDSHLVGKVVKKFYENNNLIKVEIYMAGQKWHVYEIKYE